MNSAQQVVVAQATTQEMWRSGLQFLRDRYQKALGVVPSAPDVLFVAKSPEAVVGTIGIHLPDSNGLRVCIRHQVQQPESPSVEFCRWASDSGSISVALFQHAVEYSLQHGYIQAWCEQQESVNRRCRKTGVALTKVPGAHICHELLEADHRLFYEQRAVDLYWLDLVQAKAALQSYVSRIYP